MTLAPDAPAAAPPAVVTAAAVLTWVGASFVGVATLLFAVILGPAFAAIFDAFDGAPSWIVYAVAGGVIGLCSGAAVCAAGLLRGSRGTRWTLVGLALVSAVAGGAGAVLVVPLLISAMALSCIVLLFTPSARAWFALVR